MQQTIDVLFDDLPPGYLRRETPGEKLARFLAHRSPRWRRHRQFVLGCAAGLLVAALVVGLVVVRHAIWTYQPLVRGGFFGVEVFSPDGQLVPSTSDETLSLLGPDDFGATIWHPPATALRVHIMVSIRNEGRYAVTVEHVSVPDVEAKTLQVSMYNERGGSSWTGTPFRPFSLAPNGEEELILRYPRPCWSIGPGSYVGTNQIGVGYEFLAVHHQMTIDISPGLILAGPVSCPAR